jgi:hypothetical protein
MAYERGWAPLVDQFLGTLPESNIPKRVSRKKLNPLSPPSEASDTKLHKVLCRLLVAILRLAP